MERSLLLRLANRGAVIFSVPNMIFPRIFLPSARTGDPERCARSSARNGCDL
ncbi:hypothetical protein FHS76_003774 [Ochrobactrum daejeonense]|uniref:Uncharacterized protein n=1 Tax=Brucella daejeonensis TaxID=659015 RepID=A0A7W9EPJ2_9HYPH|nr:hypothetical protein [Brucella daejeonensis]